MSTTYCPGCGAEFVAGVRTCPSCGVLLDDEDTLVYEMDGWEPSERATLGQLLDAQHIPHRWEGDDLVVPAADEDRIDELLDAVEYPDALDPVEDEGDDEAVYGVMSDLYVAADRIAGERSVDVELAGELFTAAAAATATPPPFGVDASSWSQVQQLAEGVVAAIEAEADDEVIARDAATLRDVLRRFV
ncbi:MAG: zinc ribbon domain-containing protein [Actinomycetota bacterium]|nr:zinc ribbon domain-containing protein [Actinomycetota bacterium]